MPFSIRRRGASGDRRRGPKLRWIVALLIALAGVGTYMLRTEINPVTGEKQHIALSVDQEKALGLEAAPELAAQMGGTLHPDRDPRGRFVVQVGQRLVEHSNAAQSPYVESFRFALLDDPSTINAFALPGGPVFITVGLYEKLEDEAQLAGVVGHEIGHVIHRHAAQHLATQQLGQMLTMAVAVGASDADDGGQRAAMIAAVVNQVVQMRYSREDESQSDHYGLEAMAQAGYDPSAMLDVMRVLKDASRGAQPPEFLASHPLPETRLHAIQAYLDREYPDGIPASLTRGRSLRTAPGSLIGEREPAE